MGAAVRSLNPVRGSGGQGPSLKRGTGPTFQASPWGFGGHLWAPKPETRGF